MKLVGFWKINTEIDAKKLAEVAAKLLEKGAFPPESMEIKEWLMCPGGNGITVAEVPDERLPTYHGRHGMARCPVTSTTSK